MKFKILLLTAAILAFGLGFTVYSYSTTANAANPASCCCKGDSCPMKNKSADGQAKMDCDCCKDGKCDPDSCPMKGTKGDHASMMKDGNVDHAAMMKKMAEGGESCPMMSGEKGDHAAMMEKMKNDPNHAAMMEKMKNDPDHAKMMGKMEGMKGHGCMCCKKHTEKKDAPNL